jgi:hypothetical protein
MKSENELSKEQLLEEIDQLISYGKEEPTINPDLLAFLETHDLIGIKRQLMAKVGTLTEEDKEWLEQFKKYD